ncbi:hypothetical protein EDC01DRAFT_747819 [Geopyxis carbonaria]|nr:hypothetical protein EDC01DRAFT_747819 [Geopyxis carbonaria]
MYGDLAQKLVQHAKRTQSLAHLPPYQTETVRAVAREVRDLTRDVEELMAGLGDDEKVNPISNPSVAAVIMVHHLCIRRNKRCLMAYHKVRLDRIEDICWNGNMDLIGDKTRDGQEAHNNAINAVGGGTNDGNIDSFSPEEEEYARQYSDLLAAAKGHWTDIDLTGSLEPPKDLFIDVRVLQDAGEIQTEYGAINLTKNSQFFVRQADVERLIAQGFLQKLN